MGLITAAQAGTSEPSQLPLPPEVEAFLAAQPKWSTSASVESGFGYRDNLLLSSADEEKSSFAHGLVDFLLLRVPHGRTEYSFFAQGEGKYYFSGEQVDHEATAWLHSELGYRLSDTLKLSLPVTGYYYDQVFDVSDLEVERLVAELRVAGMIVGPTLRWQFHRSWWVEGQIAGERKRYDDGANDSRIQEGTVSLGWRLGDRVEARLSGMQRQRGFDERVQYSAAGRELLGTELEIRETEGELRVAVTWDQDGRWQTHTRAGALRYTDNGSGYFNYREQMVGQEVEWKRGPWLVRCGGTARRLDFEVQIVGLGIDPPLRIKDEFEAEMRIERKLGSRWTIFGDYSWERSRSNDAIASYVVNEGLLGARWSWER